MGTVGIVCEYNPFHLGHLHQLAQIRRADPDAVIVCAMSGSFVQRGEPAVFSRTVRAEAAVRCGADLVVELPVQVSLSSAEGFAAGAVELLGRLGVEKLCFGAETGDGERLMNAARCLLQPELHEALRGYLDAGLSFPAARARAFAELGGEPGLLDRPNDILGVEYCKAILSRNLPMEPMVIARGGDYHAREADAENPSATALRLRLERGEGLSSFVPECLSELYAGSNVHTLQNGERAVLARLRSMTEADYEQIPFGGEGLWRKLMKEARRAVSLEALYEAVKSKRYTRTRIQRMVLCAFLGLTAEDLQTPAPYARVLAMTPRGGRLVKNAPEGDFRNLGERTRDLWQDREDQLQRLYALFGRTIDPADKERIFIG